VLSLATEVVPVLLHIDKDALHLLLQSLDDMVRLLASARISKGRPSVVVEALRTRRQGTRVLADLIRGARRTVPTQAADLAESFDSLQRFLQDSVHNIQQETSLQLMG
jgi:hypothetical protein